MEKAVEKEFFKAFESGGVVNLCFDWMRQKYDLGFKFDKEDEAQPQKSLSDDWQTYYDEKLPGKINELKESFNYSVIRYAESSLIDEIANNIETLADGALDRYIFTLLKPFKEFSDNIHPEAIIKQLKGEVNGICGIKDFEENLKHWEKAQPDEQLFNVNGEKAGTPKEQADACREFIEEHKYRIERVNYVASRYIDIICKLEHGAKNMQKGTVENCLSSFFGVIRMFADRLDALLLERGINLLWYQKECGIYLKIHRSITDVDYYIGSYELTIKYIDEALPRLETLQSEYIPQPSKDDSDISKSNNDIVTNEMDKYSLTLLAIFKNNTIILNKFLKRIAHRQTDAAIALEVQALIGQKGEHKFIREDDIHKPLFDELERLGYTKRGLKNWNLSFKRQDNSKYINKMVEIRKHYL